MRRGRRQSGSDDGNIIFIIPVMGHILLIFSAQGYKRPPLGEVSIMATFQCPEATRVTP